jgi:glycosyltransferase involved in cell wall biosynthesis
LRVLYFVEKFWPYIGGVEVMSARMLPLLAARGIEVTVVTTRSAGDELPDRGTFQGIEVLRLPIDHALRSNDVEQVVEVKSRFAEIKREVRPDVLNMVFTGPGIYFPVMTANIAPCPMVLSFHGSWPLVDLRRHVLLRRAVEATDWFTTCSESTLADLRSLDETIEARSETIFNGLDPPPFEPSPLSLDPPVLLCLGRVEPEKGFDVAVRAMPLLRERFPEIRLQVVGEGTELELLRALVGELGLGTSVELLGWRSPDSVPRLVDGATAVLVPSLLEGFGLVALEGMLGERPVIASRAGGLPEVIGDGGILVEPGDVKELSTAVARLLEDPVEARRVARAGRLRAQARFALDHCADGYEQVYRRMTNGHVH